MTTIDKIMEQANRYALRYSQYCGARVTNHDLVAGEAAILRALITQAIAEARDDGALREALHKDAERYRWLREQHWSNGLLAVVEDPKHTIKLGSDCPSLDRLDAVIDAALLATRAIGAV